MKRSDQIPAHGLISWVGIYLTALTFNAALSSAQTVTAPSFRACPEGSSSPITRCRPMPDLAP